MDFDLKNDVQVSFTVYDFECPTEDLTRLLGIDPTYAYQKGDLRQGLNDQKVVVSTSIWRLTSPLTHDTPVEEQIQWLIKKLAPYQERIAKLADRYSTELSCTLLNCSEERPGISLDKSILNQVAALGTSIDIDIYCLTTKPDSPIREQFFTSAIGEGDDDSLLFTPTTALEILDWIKAKKLVLQEINIWSKKKQEFRVEDWFSYQNTPEGQIEARHEAERMLRATALPKGASFVSFKIPESS